MRRVRAVVLGVSLALTACHGYQVHPGAVSTADSQIYDALLVAETTIDGARPQVSALPSGSVVRVAFSKLVEVYNVTRTAWLTYRGAVAVKDASAAQWLATVQRDISDLSAALAAFKGAR